MKGREASGDIKNEREGHREGRKAGRWREDGEGEGGRLERGVKEIRGEHRGGRQWRDSGREHTEYSRRKEPPIGKHCPVSHPQAAASGPA